MEGYEGCGCIGTREFVGERVSYSHLAHVGGVDGGGPIRLNLQSYDGEMRDNGQGGGK